MEELKQLIREDKTLLHQVDEHMRGLKDLLMELQETKLLFAQFFEKQDKFMDLMQSLMEKRK